MLNTNFTPFPTLTTERLVLRQITKDDVNETFILRSDEEVMRYINRPKAKSVVEAMRFIEMITAAWANNESIYWAISLKNDPKLIGSICIWQIEQENYRAEIGYTLLPAYHRKGIMNEAMKAALDYGFNTMNLHSVEANVNPENLGSIKVLEKNNFIREGYFRENYFFEGKFLDSAVYSLVPPLK